MRTRARTLLRQLREMNSIKGALVWWGRWSFEIFSIWNLRFESESECSEPVDNIHNWRAWNYRSSGFFCFLSCRRPCNALSSSIHFSEAIIDLALHRIVRQVHLEDEIPCFLNLFYTLKHTDHSFSIFLQSDYCCLCYALSTFDFLEGKSDVLPFSNYTLCRNYTN